MIGLAKAAQAAQAAQADSVTSNVSAKFKSSSDSSDSYIWSEQRDVMAAAAAAESGADDVTAAEKKEDEEMHELDQELIKDFEDEGKRKDERIKKLEDELQRAKKEIALAGFASRPKLGGSISGNTKTHSNTSAVDSDDSTSGVGTGSNVSNVSNVSTDSSVKTASANIHLLEMSIFHSRKDFSSASRAAAEAEKYMSSLDAKTQLAVKAWHASNVALSDSGELNVAKQLFEDALFIAQGMKNDKGGKAFEDKCNA